MVLLAGVMVLQLFVAFAHFGSKHFGNSRVSSTRRLVPFISSAFRCERNRCRLEENPQASPFLFSWRCLFIVRATHVACVAVYYCVRDRCFELQYWKWHKKRTKSLTTICQVPHGRSLRLRCFKLNEVRARPNRALN
jgi:hypothetical protein